MSEPPGNVVGFPGASRLDTDPERVLQAAVDAGLEGVVIAGFTKDGDEYFASSYADGADALWLLERMKFELLAVDKYPPPPAAFN